MEYVEKNVQMKKRLCCVIHDQTIVVTVFIFLNAPEKCPKSLFYQFMPLFCVDSIEVPHILSTFFESQTSN